MVLTRQRGTPQHRIVDYEWVLGEVGLEDRRPYAKRMRSRAVEELEQRNACENEKLRRGWCLGGASFRESVLDLMTTPTEAAKCLRSRERFHQYPERVL
jgi:hypothetical protein